MEKIRKQEEEERRRHDEEERRKRQEEKEKKKEEKRKQGLTDLTGDTNKNWFDIFFFFLKQKMTYRGRTNAKTTFAATTKTTTRTRAASQIEKKERRNGS